MPNLNIAITKSSGDLIDSYVLRCAERPGLDGEEFDARYVIDLIRSHAERHRFVPDFPLPPELSTEQVTFQLSDPSGGVRVQNINELWF